MVYAWLALALAPQSYSARLGNGVEVRVEAVGTENPRRYWQPNGASGAGTGSLPDILRRTNGAGVAHWTYPVNPLLRYVFLNIHGTEGPPSIASQFGNGPIRPPMDTHRASTRQRLDWLAQLAGNHGEDEVTLKVGVGIGPWSRLGSVVHRTGGQVTKTGIGFLRMVRPWQDPKAAKGKERQVIVSGVLPTDLQAFDYRIAAYDRKGAAMPQVEASYNDATQSMDYKFTGNYDDVGHVELQARRYFWTSFPHVHLAAKR